MNHAHLWRTRKISKEINNGRPGMKHCGLVTFRAQTRDANGKGHCCRVGAKWRFSEERSKTFETHRFSVLGRGTRKDQVSTMDTHWRGCGGTVWVMRTDCGAKDVKSAEKWPVLGSRRVLYTLVWGCWGLWCFKCFDDGSDSIGQSL